jgi:NAD(P)H dehydrogenase (quinone)
MRVSVILAHPDVQSFNHAIAQAAIAELTRQGHQVVFHDLYVDGFDPALPAGEIPKDAHLSQEIALHCQEISCADGIIIIHPNWWGQPPAILKGWIDRVTSTVEQRCEWLREVRDTVGRYLPGEIGA